MAFTVRVFSLFIRLFFLAILLAGVGLGIAYPWAADNFAGYEAATSRVFAGNEFSPLEVRLAPSEVPVFVTVAMATRGPLRADRQGAVLTVTVSSDGQTLLAEALDFNGVEPRVVSPQSGETVYRTRLEPIAEVPGGELAITIARGDEQSAEIMSIDVIVEASAIDLDPRAIPAGYVLMALGLIGFVRSLRRKSPKSPNPSPPPKWGR